MNKLETTQSGRSREPIATSSALPEGTPPNMPIDILDDVENVDDTQGSAATGIPSSRGFWSWQRLKRHLSAGDIITNQDGSSAFDSERLDPAAYRLRMGPEAYISPATEDASRTVKQLNLNEDFYIPPGQFAFLLTEEIIKVPSAAIAFVALRSTKTKFRGLVNVSGFHADSGYHGRIVFAVYNAGPGDVHLRRGDELFAIFFADLDEETQKPRSRGKENMTIGSDLINPIAGEIKSLAGLNAKIDDVDEDLKERLEKIERELAITRWAAALILGGLISLLVRAFTFPT
jgi:dCTP deaminase